MSIAEILLLSPLLLVSGWLGYLNYRILKVTEEVLKVTHMLNKVTIHVDTLTKQIVTNTSMPAGMSSDAATATATRHSLRGSVTSQPWADTT